MKHILHRTIGFMFIHFLFSTCSPTRITSSWKDPAFNIPAYKNIAVAALLDGLNKRTLREFMERHMAEDLRKMGYEAKAITDVYDPKALKDLSEDEIVNTLREKGFDAVITLAVIDIRQMQDYIPGILIYRPSAIYYNRFGRYYSYWYERVYTPGYYVPIRVM